MNNEPLIGSNLSISRNWTSDGKIDYTKKNTKDMKNNKVIKVEHIWCEEDDRWIYLEYNEQNKICGMSFMQGDEYEVFLREYAENDPGLLEFYVTMLYTFPIEQKSVDRIAFLNKVMWAYVSADQIRAKY